VSADAEFGDWIFGNTGEYDGSMRVVAPGSAESGAEVRIVIIVLPLFTGSTKLPVNVAPAWSTISSPGCAASSAAWRSPPAFTVRVTASAGDARCSRQTSADHPIAFEDSRPG
jgi:hypothetical protein